MSAGAMTAALIAVLTLSYVGVVHWQLSRRIGRIERSRASIAGSEPYQRIWRSVEFTERQRDREQTLMAAVGATAPVQLYRREGSRFVPHGDPS